MAVFDRRVGFASVVCYSLCFVKEHGATKNYHCVFTVIGKIIQFFCVFNLVTNSIYATGIWLVSTKNLTRKRQEMGFGSSGLLCEVMLWLGLSHGTCNLSSGDAVGSFVCNTSDVGLVAHYFFSTLIWLYRYNCNGPFIGLLILSLLNRFRCLAVL